VLGSMFSPFSQDTSMHMNTIVVNKFFIED
jgi:hypothetical protein